MDRLYIYHHLGLGDHLMCNALVRELSKNENSVMLFCKSHNLESVKFMYRDLNNIEFLVGDDFFVKCFFDNNKMVRNIKIGFMGDNFPGNLGFREVLGEKNIIQTFYRQAKLDYRLRWSSWKLNRDTEREEKLYEEMIKTEDYIFVHDDKSRNYVIKDEYLNGNIVRVNRNSTNNIFDYCKILESAKEIHCIDSSFRILCEHLNVTKNLFFHQYSKGSGGWGVPLSLKKWIIHAN